MKPDYNNAPAAQTVALLVIGWIVSDTGRAERFLTLTGLDPDQLRTGLSDMAVQHAALEFLLAHEPDLLACAEDTGIAPAQIVGAHADLRA